MNRGRGMSLIPSVVLGKHVHSKTDLQNDRVDNILTNFLKAWGMYV